MAIYRFIGLMLAGLLVAGMVFPTAAMAQIVHVTMGINGMV